MVRIATSGETPVAARISWSPADALAPRRQPARWRTRIAASRCEFAVYVARAAALRGRPAVQGLRRGPCNQGWYPQAGGPMTTTLKKLFLPPVLSVEGALMAIVLSG